MANSKFQKTPTTQKYKVLKAGFLLGGHRAEGDIINLYPEQAVNYLPPFGKAIALLDDDGEIVVNDATASDENNSTDTENSGGNDDQDGTGNQDGDSGDDGAGDDKTKELMKLTKNELLKKLESINEILSVENKIKFDDAMTKAELVELIGAE